MKSLPPIAKIAIVWVITAIPLYKISLLGVPLPNYTLFALVNVAFFFGYLRREDLSAVVKITMSLILALWCSQCWVIFSTVFPLDLLKFGRSSNGTALLLFNTFLIFFLSVLTLSPLLVGTFGKYASKMAFLVSLPVVFATSSLDSKDYFSFLISAGLIVTSLSAIMVAVNLVYFSNLQLQKMSRSVPKKTLGYRTKPGLFFSDEKR
ncbi:MAG: hypothetical protein HGB26_01135 [Desulfobulbaceae bacterium]|nr:hypothetical protein [Desulfobulbaceae bacterium]